MLLIQGVVIKSSLSWNLLSPSAGITGMYHHIGSREMSCALYPVPPMIAFFKIILQYQSQNINSDATNHVIQISLAVLVFTYVCVCRYMLALFYAILSSVEAHVFPTTIKMLNRLGVVVDIYSPCYSGG
jgi:hypothetical protein